MPSPEPSSASARRRTRRRDRRRRRSQLAADGSILDGQVWFVADAIPAGVTAAVALIEHLWAAPLRDAINGAGGLTLADEWIHPEDLVAIGIAASEDS